MTDNETIKALECCLSKSFDDCIKCTLNDFSTDYLECRNNLLENVRVLINRQKAEIERLKGSVIVNNIMESQKIKKEAKTEAIKEFAERLKINITINNTNDGYLDYSVDYHCLMEDIDDLVKEMVREEA